MRYFLRTALYTGNGVGRCSLCVPPPPSPLLSSMNLTGDLNKAVTRNLDRFPEDFAFQLTREEAQNLMFQVGTSSSQSSSDEKIRNVRRGYGGTRKPARVFTEQGVAMLDLTHLYWKPITRCLLFSAAEKKLLVSVCREMQY